MAGALSEGDVSVFQNIQNTRKQQASGQFDHAG
jgi:hypothetical protein